jgi:hypothetical protein
MLRWLRSGRVTRRDAQQLLDRAAPEDAPRGLVDLLAVASAPPRPDELAGERAAVAGFQRAYRPDAAGERGAGPRRSPARRPRRRRVAVVAAVAVVALFGGTAYAAGTGILPEPVQRQLHEKLAGVGFPPPEPGDTPEPRTSPAASPSPPARTLLLALCRTWRETRAGPGRPELRPDEERVLADAAGGRNRIESFCAALAGTPASGTPTTSAPGKPEKTIKPGNPNPATPPTKPPGQGDGQGNGNRNGTGRGNGPPG